MAHSAGQGGSIGGLRRMIGPQIVTHWRRRALTAHKPALARFQRFFRSASECTVSLRDHYSGRQESEFRSQNDGTTTSTVMLPSLLLDRRGR